jgi:hypothetical protein
MGTVTKGAGAARQIVLTGKTAAALEGLKIANDSRWLSVRPASTINAISTATASMPTRTLDIMLASDAPAGVFQDSVTVTLANGQRLMIPVNAYVRP